MASMEAQSTRVFLPPGISPRLAAAAEEALAQVAPQWEAAARRGEELQWRVLACLQEQRLGEADLGAGVGYGYGDSGRAKLDRAMARLFGAEAALVRQSVVSGTHAVALALFAALRPGDELLVATGEPYPSLAGILGLRHGTPGSLAEWGVSCRVADGPERAAAAVGPRTKAVLIQRSRGYAWRSSLGVGAIGELIGRLRAARPELRTVVDNCYGELVEELEPTAVGADLIAGSLIKNPGGGLAPGGGYVAGRAELVERAAARLTAPGLGSQIGPALSPHRIFFQGLFLAPQVVAAAVQGAVFAARFFELLGFETLPGWEEPRTDIVQAVRLGSAEAVLAFCRGVQLSAPVDAHAVPEPGDLPGYSQPVVMAGGTFVQGASLELSADAPLAPPYVVYLQGGLTRSHAVWGAVGAARELERRGFLP